MSTLRRSRLGWKTTIHTGRKTISTHDVRPFRGLDGPQVTEDMWGLQLPPPICLDTRVLGMAGVGSVHGSWRASTYRQGATPDVEECINTTAICSMDAKHIQNASSQKSLSPAEQDLLPPYISEMCWVHLTPLLPLCTLDSGLAVNVTK